MYASSINETAEQRGNESDIMRMEGEYVESVSMQGSELLICISSSVS